MRFLVDENLPAEVSHVLGAAGHDVLDVSASDHRGATDQEVWRIGSMEGRILMTRDLDFPLLDVPRPPGLILLRVPDSFTKEQIASIVSEFIESAALEDAVGAITVLSPGRVRSRPI